MVGADLALGDPPCPAPQRRLEPSHPLLGSRADGPTSGEGELGLGSALGGGITFTALTSGGGFEDALYATGATPAGTVDGAPALVSSVQGGNGTLAWEPSAGVVANVGWSGAPISAKAVTALRNLAAGTYLLTCCVG